MDIFVRTNNRWIGRDFSYSDSFEMAYYITTKHLPINIPQENIVYEIPSYYDIKDNECKYKSLDTAREICKFLNDNILYNYIYVRESEITIEKSLDNKFSKTQYGKWIYNGNEHNTNNLIKLLSDTYPNNKIRVCDVIPSVHDFRVINGKEEWVNEHSLGDYLDKCNTFEITDNLIVFRNEFL